MSSMAPPVARRGRSVQEEIEEAEDGGFTTGGAVEEPDQEEIGEAMDGDFKSGGVFEEQVQEVSDDEQLREGPRSRCRRTHSGSKA